MRLAAVSFFLGLFILFQAPAARAGKSFGAEYWYIFVQNIDEKGLFHKPGEAWYMARKIRVEKFILPYALTDEGYVLATFSTKEWKSIYAPLDEAKLKELQAKRLLPDPMPPFQMGTYDYVMGYSLWLLLAFMTILVGGTVTIRWRRSIINAIHAARGAWTAILDPDIAAILKRIKKLSCFRTKPNPQKLAQVRARTGYSNHALWLLALDGVNMSGWAADHHALDYGATKPSEREDHRENLQVLWGISNREDLLTMLARIRKGMHSHEYNDAIEFWRSNDPGLKFAMAHGERSRKDLQIIGATTKFVRDRSLAAWDYGRGLRLAKSGYVLGFLSEEEAWRHIRHFGTEIGQRYDSWLDYGLNFLIGGTYWAENKDEYFDAIEKNLKTLLGRDGAWTIAPWAKSGELPPLRLRQEPALPDPAAQPPLDAPRVSV